jgi:hypothetical protein
MRDSTHEHLRLVAFGVLTLVVVVAVLRGESLGAAAAFLAAAVAWVNCIKG